VARGRLTKDPTKTTYDQPNVYTMLPVCSVRRAQRLDAGERRGSVEGYAAVRTGGDHCPGCRPHTPAPARTRTCSPVVEHHGVDTRDPVARAGVGRGRPAQTITVVGVGGGRRSGGAGGAVGLVAHQAAMTNSWITKSTPAFQDWNSEQSAEIVRQVAEDLSCHTPWI